MGFGKLGIVKEVTFSLDTAAYAAGDLLADTQEVGDVARENGGTVYWTNVILLDKDDQGVELNVLLLSSSTSLGTENDAPTVSDANALNVVGSVKILSTDWLDLGGCKVTVQQVSFKSALVMAATDSRKFYAALVNGSGTPTFSAAGLVAKFGFLYL